MRALLIAALALLPLPIQAVERVVSLAPSLNEVMLELGADDLLVGIIDGGIPVAPRIDHLPRLGRVGQVEMEQLLSLQPDLILLWPDSIGSAQREQLQRLGIALHEMRPRRMDELADAVELLGERIGRGEQARARVAEFRRRLATLRAEHRRERPLKVFYQVWDRPLYTVGGEQFISDALRVCGAENVFADLSLAAPQISLESVLLRAPEVILTGEAAMLEDWQRWPQIPAVRMGQVWVIPDEGLQRPSLQLLDATAALCRLLEGAQSAQ